MTHIKKTGVAIIPLIIAASLAMFMSSLDGTIVNIAIPTISSFFDISTSTVSWVCTIYLLISAGLLLIIGKLTDIIGYRKIFIFGFIVFTFGSFFCGFFPDVCYSFPLLLIGRVIQAFGGVSMMVVAPALISTNLPADKLGRGMSIIMLFATVGMALGPTLGGLLTQYFSWNWIFFVNIPIGIIAVILGLIVIPKDKKSGTSMKGFDGIGAALIFVGLFSLLFVVSEGATLGWTSIPILVSIGLAIVGIVGFIIREKKVKMPILDLNIFKNKSFLVLSIVFSLLFFVFSGVNYLLPFYLESVRGIETLDAGLLMTVMSFGLMVTGLLGGVLYQKFIGKRKILIMAGIALIILGFLFLSFLNSDGSLAPCVIGMALIGLGLGMNTTVISSMMLGSATEDKQGMVSSLATLERMVPLSIGIAVFNLLLIAGVKYIANHNGIVNQTISSIPADLLVKGFDLCFLIGLILSIVIFIICIFFKEKGMNIENTK